MPTTTHHPNCLDYAAECAEQNGAEAGEQAREWAAQYLSDGMVGCQCDYYRQAEREAIPAAEAPAAGHVDLNVMAPEQETPADGHWPTGDEVDAGIEEWERAMAEEPQVDAAEVRRNAAEVGAELRGEIPPVLDEPFIGEVTVGRRREVLVVGTRDMRGETGIDVPWRWVGVDTTTSRTVYIQPAALRYLRPAEASPTREITLRPHRYNEPDRWDSPNVLRAYSRYIGRTVRLGVGYIGPDGECRRVQDGPVLPGPYAYTWAKASVIDNHGGTGAESARLQSAELEWAVKPGDRFVIDGHTFELRDDKRWEYPELVLVDEV